MIDLSYSYGIICVMKYISFPLLDVRLQVKAGNRSSVGSSMEAGPMMVFN